MSGYNDRFGLAEDDALADELTPAKKPRLFIARQACEGCRAKKTRCDEKSPCGLCESLGIECVYAERKPSKNEASLGAMFTMLARIESQLRHVTATAANRIVTASNRIDTSHTLAESPHQWDSSASQKTLHSPQSSNARQGTVPPTICSPLSCSTHYTIQWPGMQSLLPQSLAATVSAMPTSFPTRLESERPPMDNAIQAQATSKTDDWLSSLSISCIKDLSNAYLDTFNRIYPFLDRDSYFLNTLAMVVQDGFGYDAESCLVLNVMALGCLGLRGCEESGFGTSQYAHILPVRQILDEEISGLSFFNEARKRFAFCLTERSLASCQYYLTSALFYAQSMRPVDQWMMTNRAASICAAFWKCPPCPLDHWAADMQSRLFWSAILLETIVVQELEVPPSGLQDWEDIVPLPQFTPSPYLNKSRRRDSDDSYYHYHFLAQIAQRIILSRIRDELFNTNPSATLAAEFKHQLEQWRQNLPEKIRLKDNIHEPTLDCPANAVAIALLQMRYHVTIFQIGRPFLYKAIQNPSSLTSKDLDICEEALQHAIDWGVVWTVNAKVLSFMPLRFFACGQMFGLLFIFHALIKLKDDQLRRLLPAGWEIWCTKMLNFITEASSSNPTVAQDLELLRTLYLPEISDME